MLTGSIDPTTSVLQQGSALQMAEVRHSTRLSSWLELCPWGGGGRGGLDQVKFRILPAQCCLRSWQECTPIASRLWITAATSTGLRTDPCSALGLEGIQAAWPATLWSSSFLIRLAFIPIVTSYLGYMNILEHSLESSLKMKGTAATALPLSTNPVLLCKGSQVGQAWFVPGKFVLTQPCCLPLLRNVSLEDLLHDFPGTIVRPTSLQWPGLFCGLSWRWI